MLLRSFSTNTKNVPNLNVNTSKSTQNGPVDGVGKNQRAWEVAYRTAHC